MDEEALAGAQARRDQDDGRVEKVDDRDRAHQSTGGGDLSGLDAERAVPALTRCVDHVIPPYIRAAAPLRGGRRLALALAHLDVDPARLCMLGLRNA